MQEIRTTKKEKFLSTERYFELMDQFINDTYSGRRIRKNGARIKDSTIRNYTILKKLLVEFVSLRNFELRIYLVNNLSPLDRQKARLYNVQFYQQFTSFMYDVKDHYDNYVGMQIKTLRSFYNYLETECDLSIGKYHKSFFVPNEQVEIVVLTNEQLKYMICNKAFNYKIRNANLEWVKDVFVFGCVVALRISDLLKLSIQHLHHKEDSFYIRIKSQKTNTYTSVKLPGFAVDIVEKYKSENGKLLPNITINYFNERLKLLGTFLPDNFEIIKTREKRGEPILIFKDLENKIHYKLADHITAHTMRRTAITNMLCLGMPEHLVRKISGHAPNSKEFYRYVELSQSYMDEETDKIYDKMMGSKGDKRIKKRLVEL